MKTVKTILIVLAVLLAAYIASFSVKNTPKTTVMEAYIQEIDGDTVYVTQENERFQIDNFRDYLPRGEKYSVGDGISIEFSGSFGETAPTTLNEITSIKITYRETEIN